MTTPLVDRFHFLAREARGEKKTPILAEAPTTKVADRVATLRLYDPIDSDGGPWGVSAKEFAAVLDGLADDTREIRLHVNSPGGMVWDGLAILNALRQHPARVVVVVDGLAASAASFIAMAGDEVIMAPNSEMMIHSPFGLALGNAADMQKMAADLAHEEDNLAAIYQSKAGGTLEQWRAAMAAETWYSAQEAVDAGLADRVAEKEPAEAEQAKARYNLAVFAYAGRAKAPAPVLAQQDPTTPAAEPARGYTPKEGAGMDPAKLREAFGLPAEASDDEVRAAVAASGLVPQASAPAENPPAASADDAQPEGTAKPAPKAEGTITIDASAWQEREDRIKRLEGEAAKRRRDERDAVIASAVAEGKFPPARKEHWARLWEADPEGTRQVIAGLARNVVPVDMLGSDLASDEDFDAEYASLFPKGV